jgi:invasion protein IalB
MKKRGVLSSLSVLMLSAQTVLAQSPQPPASGAWNPAVSKSGDAKPKAGAAKPAAVEAPKKSETAQKAAPAAAPQPTAAAPAPPTSAAAQAPAAVGPPVETGAVTAAPASQATKSGDWLLECSSDTAKPSCTLRQLVADAKKRRIIEMRATSVGVTAFLEVIVPTGISIPYGVSVDVAEGKKLPAQLVDCSPIGCRAALPLSAENLTALKTATTLAVTFQDSKSGKVISISGSPKGFEPGIAKVIGAR